MIPATVGLSKRKFLVEGSAGEAMGERLGKLLLGSFPFRAVEKMFPEGGNHLAYRDCITDKACEETE